MTTARLVLCLVACCVPAQSFIVFQEEQDTKFSIVFQDEDDVPRNTTTRPPINTNFSRQELECFRKDSLLYGPTATCYPLHVQGPCAKDEWIVLDKDEVEAGDGRLLAACRKCPCCDQPRPAVFWREDGRCHKLHGDSSRLCPSPGTKLSNGPFGEGECSCVKEPPHAREKDDNAPCFPLYHRGPCDNGYIFVPSENTTRCEKDPCALKNQGNMGEPFVLWRADNRCYQIGGKGPCADNFNIDPVTLQPACGTRVLQIIDLPQTCDTDQNGICRKEIALPSQTQYLNNLLQSAYKWRKKRRTKP